MKNPMEDSVLISKETQEASELLKEKLAKEAKKITRIPFYKLEELKKQEEKKLKNIHKFKKKEKEKEEVNTHIKASGKKMKKTKKQKDEAKTMTLASKTNEGNNNDSSIILDGTPKRNISQSPSKQLCSNVNVAKSTTSLVHSTSSTGNRLHDLKYQQTFKIPRKQRLRLSKKQMKLQYPENSIGSFLSQEDKITIANLIKNMKPTKKSESDSNMMFGKNNAKSTKNINNFQNHFNSSVSNDSINEGSMMSYSAMKYVKSDMFNNTNTLNNSASMKIEEKEEDGAKDDNEEKKDLIDNEDKKSSKSEDKKNPRIECIHKKRKRFTKYKKAIYKYRLEKKRYLYNTIFNPTPEQNKDTDTKKEVEKQKEIVENNSIPTHQMKQRNFDNVPNTLMMNYYNYNNECNNITTTYYQHPFNPYQYAYPNNYAYYDFYNFNDYQIVQTDPNNKFSFEYMLNRKDINLNPKPIQSVTNQSSVSHTNKNYINDLQNKAKNVKQNKFSFESKRKDLVTAPINNNNQKKEEQFEKFKQHLKETYNMEDIDIQNLNGKDITEFLKKHKDIEKINLNQIQTFIPEDIMKKYLQEYEGIQNPSQKKIIREYVDQVLDKTLDTKFSSFIEKLRDLYYKKKTVAPLKVKKRFVVGMREIEKFIRLNQLLCLFVVPNIEKVSGDKNSLDERLLKIFCMCRGNGIPIFFGLNKFKLGKAARKKMSCVSMLGFINVEGFENDLKGLIKFGEQFRKEWYIKHYDEKEELSKNKFIQYNLFEIYHNEDMQNENTGRDNKDEIPVKTNSN